MKKIYGFLVIMLIGCSIGIGVFIGYKISDNYASKVALEKLISEGYANTKEATASSEDLLEGRSGYVNGVKVIGTYKPTDTSNANATSEAILEGYIAIVDGEKVEGRIKSLKQYNLVAKTYAVSTESNVYLAKDLVIKGDENLIAENIKKGVTIFNVTGTYEPIGGVEDESE